MLEQLVKGNPKRNSVSLNHSSNLIFAEDGAVERSLEKAVNFTYDVLYKNRDTTNMSKKEKIVRLGAAHALMAAMGVSYVTTEAVCRGSEAVGRLAVKGANAAYEKAADKWDWAKSLGKKIGFQYKNLRRKFPRSFRERVKDPLIVGSSVAALLLTGGLARSCTSEEPVESDRIERPVAPDYQDTDSAFYVPSIDIPEIIAEGSEEVSGTITGWIDSLTPKPENGVWPLSRFSNRTVLAYCANQMEKDYVLETLKSHDNGIRSIYINGEETQANIVNAHGNEVTIDIRTEGERVPNKKYNIIALRGHTDDMIPLQRTTEGHEAENTIYLLGGCQSAAFIDNLAKPERPVFGVREGIQGQGPINTYALLRVIDEMDGNATWDEMNANLRTGSVRIRNEFVLPGTTEYARRLER
jgi:hypothetical protein